MPDETEGFEPEGELDLGDVHEYREVPDVLYAHLVNARCTCGWRMGGCVKRGLAQRLWQEHAPQGELDLGDVADLAKLTAAGVPPRAAVLAALPAKWRATAAEVWTGDGAFPAGYIDGIQRRRTAGTLLACAEELESAIAGLGGAL